MAKIYQRTRAGWIELKPGKPPNPAGLKWWNNGLINVRRAESPGPEWKLGRNVSQRNNTNK